MNQFNSDMYAEFNKYPFYCNPTCMQDAQNVTSKNFGIFLIFFIFLKHSQPSQYARSLYDAIYLYCLALNRTFSQLGYSKNAARNATLLLQNSSGSFQGKTGNVIIDQYGNRIPGQRKFAI